MLLLSTCVATRRSSASSAPSSSTSLSRNHRRARARGAERAGTRTPRQGPMDSARHVIIRRHLNTVSGDPGDSISSKTRVYLLKDRDPVGLPSSGSVGISKWAVLIGRTGFDTIHSIPDQTLSLTDKTRFRGACDDVARTIHQSLQPEPLRASDAPAVPAAGRAYTRPLLSTT